MLASILLVVISFFVMIYGIAAIADSHVFVADAHHVIGDLRAWGWFTLIIAVLELVVGRHTGGRPAGTLVRGGRARADAIDMMFFSPAYPFGRRPSSPWT